MTGIYVSICNSTVGPMHILEVSQQWILSRNAHIQPCTVYTNAEKYQTKKTKQNRSHHYQQLTMIISKLSPPSKIPINSCMTNIVENENFLTRNQALYSKQNVVT